MNKRVQLSFYLPRFPDAWPRGSLYGLATWTNGLAFRDFQFSVDGKPVIKIAELKNDVSAQTNFTQQTFDSCYHIANGDMLFAWSGSPDTSIDIFWWHGRDGWLNQHIFKVEPNVECDRVFFYILLKYLKPLLIEIARNKQTTGLGHVTVKDLQAITVGLPPLPIQRRIADILGALNNKIECNRRINQALEAMAQALYKYWFVDSSDSEYRPITDFIQVDPTVEIPRNREAPFVEMKALPVWSMSVTDVARRRFAGGSKFENGDTLLAAITPSLENGKTAFVDFLEDDEAGWGSTEFIVLRAKQGVSPQFVYCSARDEDLRTRAIKSMVGSSGRQRVRRDFLDQFEIKAFSERTMTAFHERTLSWFKQIRANIKENQTLTRTRDYLLPKLLSGEVEVKEQEEQLDKTL